MISKFRFCPNCKKPLKKLTNRLIDCTNCEFHFYLSPASTNALILENQKGEILLTKRKFLPKKGCWDLPGGFINFGETVEESLKREIKEELGIELKKFKYLGSYWSIYPYKGISYQTLCHVFISKYRGENLSVKDDISEFKFFPKNKIPLEKMSFEDVKNALKDYVSGRQARP